MGKYDSLNRKRKNNPNPGPHPIWRGIGCLMIVLMPVISFGLAALTMDTALREKWPLPVQFLGTPQLPRFLYRSDVLVPMLDAIRSVTNLYGYIAFTVLYAVILAAVLSFVYAIAYRVVGPPTYGPLDMPPLKGQKAQRYKR